MTEHLRNFKVIDADAPLIDRLKPQYQAVLRATGRYTDRAAQLQIPVGTVRSRLHRARAALTKLRARQAA